MCFRSTATRLRLTASASGTIQNNVIVTGGLRGGIFLTQPIANAAIVINIKDPNGVTTGQNKTTDATGAFSVSVPLTVIGNYVITASYLGKPNEYQSGSASCTIQALAAPLPVTITLTPSATVANVGSTVTIQATLVA